MATKKYDEDFKQMIVELYENKKPICEIKREYGIFEFIESWYNRRRIHSSIGYKIPYELENQKIC